MRHIATALTTIFVAMPLCADTCLAPKNAVRAAVACGHVYDPAGEFVANVDLELVSNGKTIAIARTDLQGNFMFAPVPTGERLNDAARGVAALLASEYHGLKVGQGLQASARGEAWD